MLEQCAAHWFETVCRPKLKPYSVYSSVMKTWILSELGKKAIALVKPSDARLVYRAINAAERSSSAALKPQNIMSSKFKSARRDGIVGRSVMAYVDAPRAAAVRRDFPDVLLLSTS